MNSIQEFRLKAILEFYLFLQVMTIFGTVVFYLYLLQNDHIPYLVFMAVYTVLVVLKVICFVNKVYFKKEEKNFRPFLWSILIDGIFLSAFLYFARDLFPILAQMFCIYLVLLIILFQHKRPLACSSFVALCYVSVAVLQDRTALFTPVVIVQILLFFLLGYIMGVVNHEINRLVGRLCYMNEDLEHKNSLLNEMVSKDYLTSLYNHKTFYIYYKEIITRSYESQNSLSLALLDIDNFKKINDTYGHLAGDQVLQKISALIQANVRKNDVAARYGGEEFAIIFPDTLPEIGNAVCERIRNLIAGHEFVFDNQIIQVTISGGVAGGICMEPRYKNNELFTCVDQLLYQAKGQGKNRILCSPELVQITDDSA
ncbi:diguanylate cyclase [Syntrophobotulus glycolicus DSM 8271]|uniref:Diguanylate cyclase n=1 Tax=Syntrophobotulus glycolicus (strain DSM 8271 / FlGlyR) TaxID=645991 RepID=F0SVL3_SYNGF|nr:GGDEF domain-containing protein [Syntrophobotulus glycolicus]ADY54489.1 diguanylate cyclase [Syntrophobotulus glycolicus DSM 8271]